MQRLLITIEPRSGFVSPLKGGQLFGQLAWTIAEAFGSARLTSLLDGYVDGRPFLVLSDAMPSGVVPMPAMPVHWWAPEVDAQKRKRIKALRWLPREALREPVASWRDRALTEDDLAKSGFSARSGERTRNTISRATGTTGEGRFAPFDTTDTSFGAGSRLDIHAILDETRLDRKEFLMLLENAGLFGFGADASSGAGKFVVMHAEVEPDEPPSTHFLTLAAMSPVVGVFRSDRTFYKPVTYFGRHGNVRALSSVPFKKPLLLADTGAFLTVHAEAPQTMSFAGRGIVGHSAYADTVAQGYAPLLAVTPVIRH